jgi:hypothetical protein
MSNSFLLIGAVILGVLVLAVVALALYPTLVRLEPAYKNAEAVCDSIKVGMTYEDVKAKVGHLFFPEPMTYIDQQGNGQAQLKNDVKNLDTSCFIRFQNGKVISADMAYVWL